MEARMKRTFVLPGVIEELMKFNHDVPMEFSKYLSDDAELRRLRIAHERGWLEVDTPIQSPTRWVSYRLTPKGMAVLDQYLISRSTIH